MTPLEFDKPRSTYSQQAPRYEGISNLLPLPPVFLFFFATFSINRLLSFLRCQK